MATTPASSADPADTTMRSTAFRPPVNRGPAVAAGTSVTGGSRPSLAEIIEAQEEIFGSRQPESARLAALANGSLAGGVVSSWQISRPQPVWLSHGIGSKLYDVDGNEYVDLHGGYGVSLAGHGHPAIVRAVQAPGHRGPPFAQPPEGATAGATPPSARIALPPWRVAP